jgi:hypothetical protein
MCVYDKAVAQINDDSKDFKLISDIKDAVDLLSEEKIKGFSQDANEFKLHNQNGVSLDMSKEDTRCLTAAMILHEKGKNFIKSKEFVKALILLAEADTEFK